MDYSNITPDIIRKSIPKVVEEIEKPLRDEHERVLSEAKMEIKKLTDELSGIKEAAAKREREASVEKKLCEAVSEKKIKDSIFTDARKARILEHLFSVDEGNLAKAIEGHVEDLVVMQTAEAKATDASRSSDLEGSQRREGTSDKDASGKKEVPTREEIRDILGVKKSA